MTKKKLEVKKVLMLRTCNADMTSAHDNKFKWPESGRVEAPDWKDDGKCGHGLHGNLWGAEDSSYFSESPDAKWLVCEVEETATRDLAGKHKFPSCDVVFCGDMHGAVDFLCADPRTPKDAKIHGAVKTAGYAGTATAGYAGTATAGIRGTATAGDYGTATAGDSGTATAGIRGTATAGIRGTATAGIRGTATAGNAGVLCILFWDAVKGHYRRRAVEVDGVNILPNVPYVLDADGNFVRKS